MRVFVFSFGSIEVIDGIVIVDASLKYKTFEKEYSEILNKSDKNIKKLLKNAFEKGEISVDNSKIEKILLDTLDTLEKYDNPSFDFIESFQTSKSKGQINAESETDISELPLLEDPGLLEDPPVIENIPELEDPDPQNSVVSEESIPEVESEAEDALGDESTLLGAADLQDELSSLDFEEDIEEPAVMEEEMEEIPISEVEAQSEGVISSFLVQMTEQADFKLSPNNKIIDVKTSGKILLKNAGKQDRIWDINLKLDKIKSTSLETDSFHINELSPGKAWEKDYTVKKQKELPLSFKERIDTFPESPEEIHTLILNKKVVVTFTFTIENQNDHEIMNIKMEKEIPKAFTDLKLMDEIPENTELKVQDHTLIWKIPNLSPKQSNNLTIQGKITPSILDSVKTGPTQIGFTKLNSFYSDILLEDISSISKNMYYIEKDEQEKQPDQWNCRLILENKSEFPILLESAEVFTGDIKSEQKATVFRAINEIIEPPSNEWISQDWTVTSEEIPTFGKKIKFKIIPSTHKSLSANISIEETELPILWTDVKKTYSLSEVASYTKTPLDVTSSIINRGSAKINEILIKDFIPENFTPPAPNKIKLLLDGKQINTDKQKINLSIKREPESDDPSQPHQIIFQISDLKDSIGEIEKNSELLIQYSTTSVNPPPEKVYNFPIAVTCNTLPEGPSLNISPDMVENSDILVTHRRRRLTIGKSVYPGTAAGEYEIEMMFKNRGNTPIENATISDLVPTNFSVLSSEPEAAINKDETEMVLEWKFDLIKPGEKVAISYKIKGIGEYKTSDAEIFYKV